ncbi:MAG TPA: hypothetical protein VF399_00475 [bacterium]
MKKTSRRPSSRQKGSNIQQIKLPDLLTLAFETNGKGYIGYVVELPGAYVRGRTREEAIAKVNLEVGSYLKWLKIKPARDHEIKIVQTHESSLMVEDADNEILLEADKTRLTGHEFRTLTALVNFSGKTFGQLYANSMLKDWVDKARVRKTFYGDNPSTIQEIFDHVKGCQHYYLSRMKLPVKTGDDFMAIRKFCLKKLEALYRKHNNMLIFELDNELWTLKKVLRRFIWHDRIHGKAIIRILEKQKRLGLIDVYNNPFCLVME